MKPNLVSLAVGVVLFGVAALLLWGIGTGLDRFLPDGAFKTAVEWIVVGFVMLFFGVVYSGRDRRGGKGEPR